MGLLNVIKHLETELVSAEYTYYRTLRDLSESDTNKGKAVICEYNLSLITGAYNRVMDLRLAIDTLGAEIEKESKD